MSDDSDAERALTPVEGVPLTSPIFRLAEPLDKNQRAMGSRLGCHLEEHDDQLRTQERRLDRIEGADGTNGKIGTLGGKVSAINKWIAAVGMVALTGAAGAIKTVFDAGEARGADRIRLEQVERTLQEVRADFAQFRADTWRNRFPSSSVTTPTREVP